LKNIIAKIVTFIVIGIILLACNAEKRVPSGKQRLVKNEIVVNGKILKSDEITNQLSQKPNSTILGFKLRLALFNLATPNPDSVYQSKFKIHPKRYERMAKLLSAKQVDRLGQSFLNYGINNFLKKTGEPPVVLDTLKTNKSIAKLKYYYFSKGFFDVQTSFKVDSIGLKKSKIEYNVKTKNAFLIDTVSTSIKTPALDSLYRTRSVNSFLKSGTQYENKNFDDEKERITAHFRSQGVYNFQSNYVTFDLDTLNNNKKVNVNLLIDDFSYQDKDSTKTVPFKIFKISDVNIYTDYSAKDKNNVFSDFTNYNNFNLFSHKKIRYKPKAITDAVFITKGSLFSDLKTVLTTRYLNNLKIFNYPTILYEVDSRDSTARSLIAKVYLSPRKKYNFGATFDATHSNIQTFGVAGSVSTTVRNIFKGAETIELSARGNAGSSRALVNPVGNFFNVFEYGMDLKLNIPRIWFPFSTEKIIPKSMIPSTLVALGLSNQINIGLDKQNVTGVLAYNWNPQKVNTARLDLFNIQYVRNLNPENYFNVYRSSFQELNRLATTYNTNKDYVNADGNLIIEKGTYGFINDVLTGVAALPSTDNAAVSSINERKLRLSEDDFILSTSYTFSSTTKSGIKDNTFYQFKTKVETAGSMLTLVSNLSGVPKNGNGLYEIFNLEYSEYIKSEFDYTKYWDFSKEKVLAVRGFLGIAIPYGNSNNVPFSRSYFAGGSNDNRAWEPYRLGPGRTGAVNDFNEANMKISLNAEFRFKIAGSIKGAFFADAGNIWNVLDNVTDKDATFDGLQDLKEMAIGTGFGLRYDLDFFVVRFDLGFKTFNPANEIKQRWFKDYNLSSSVFNFGINYPF
jgi:outer membrane protein assembly factor BamA